MKAKGDPIGARRSRRTPAGFAIALLGLLLVLAGPPGRASAAVIPDPGVDLSVFCGIGFVQDCAPGAEERPVGHLSPLDFGVALWNDAATAMETPALAPIPLPAAGWLLLAGLGALGLAQRRRQARFGAAARGSLSHRAALRLGTRADLLEAAEGLRRCPERGHLLFADPFGPAAPGPAVRAFARGEASPVRPCGGAGHRYPATAERAPPGRAAAVGRNDDGAQTTMFPTEPPRLTDTPPVAWRFPFWAAAAAA
jgi:hypothetical protein